MITADTITDEQIRELRMASVAEADKTTGRLCNDALNEGRFPRLKAEARVARIRLAEILNARIAARRCPRCQSLCDHATWDGINCPWCARQAVL